MAVHGIPSGDGLLGLDRTVELSTGEEVEVGVLGRERLFGTLVETSARLVGPHGTDAERRGRLLAELAGKPRPWDAMFRCVVAVADPAGRLLSAEGGCEGQILPAVRGQGGFGYDPLFEESGTRLTLAEMSLEQKNRLSHRGQAIRGLRPLLEEVWAGEERGRA